MNDGGLSCTRALTFATVPVVPGWSEILPNNVDTMNSIAGIERAVPLMSAAMDTVIEPLLAIAIARAGGIGVLQGNLTIKEQADNVDRVTQAQGGMITVLYEPTAERAIRYDDLDLAIDWPVDRRNAVVSDKNAAEPSFSSYRQEFAS